MTTNTAGPETFSSFKGKQFFSFKNGDYGLNVWFTETKTKNSNVAGRARIVYLVLNQRDVT